MIKKLTHCVSFDIIKKWDKRWKKWKQITLFIFLTYALLNSLNVLNADSTDTINELQARKAKAMVDYYQGINRLGPNASQSERNALYGRTIGPVQVDMANSFNGAISQTFQTIRAGVFNKLKNIMQDNISWILNPLDYHGKSKKVDKDSKSKDKNKAKNSDNAPSNRGVASKPNRNTFTIESYQKKEVIIDGSNIPAEIEFPGKKK